jgi:hypothetical protein
MYKVMYLQDLALIFVQSCVVSNNALIIVTSPHSVIAQTSCFTCSFILTANTWQCVLSCVCVCVCVYVQKYFRPFTTGDVTETGGDYIKMFSLSMMRNWPILLVASRFRCISGVCTLSHPDICASTANIIANVLTFDPTSAPFLRCGKNWNYDGGDSSSNKWKRGYGGAHGGVWRSLCLATVWSQAVGFLLVRLAGIWLQSPWRCFHI